MFPLLETIRFENGKFYNLPYHIERMKRSLKVCFGLSLQFNPETVFEKEQKRNLGNKGLFKFRFLYNDKSFRFEFVPYALPTIKTLKPVTSNTIRYGCKFTDRSELGMLTGQKEKADDVLIVQNGLITDTSFANIVFYDGKKWITPKKPLLPGTQRAFLLSQGIIHESDITLEQARLFPEARIINAMIRMEDALKVKIL